MQDLIPSFRKEIDTISMNGGAKPKLTVIYRVCDCVNACSAHARFVNVTKQALIFKCIDSIEKCISTSSNAVDIRVIAVADNCQKSTIDYISSHIPNVIIVECSRLGNARSFCSCVDIATNLHDGEMVYFLEDDYLMLNDRVFELIAYNLLYLSKVNGRHVGIMPDDYRESYRADMRHTDIIMTDSGDFYREYTTTCTFATFSDIVRKYKSNLMNFINWPRAGENESVNMLWRDGETPLYSPTYAWTMHVQIVSAVPRYIDCEKVKRYIES